MYTLMVTPDHRLKTTTIRRIVQRSKLCDNIHILIPQMYEDRNMSDCQVTMYYTLPISNEEYTKILTASEEIYKNEYLEFIIPADTWITKESGDVQVELVITAVDIDPFGEVSQYVRKITGGIIHIASSKNWGSTIADPLLSVVDQRIIQLQMLTERLEEIQEADVENLMSIKADNISLDDNFNLQLQANGKAIGDKIPVVTPSISDTNDGSNDGIYELGDYEVENDGCDCGCDHSIIELDNSSAADDDSSGFVEL